MITLDNVIPLLEKAVKIKGEDYVYVPPGGEFSTCRYSDFEGNPSCIVGYVIANAEPELYAEIVEFERREGDSFGVYELGAANDDYASDDLAPLANKAQQVISEEALAVLNRAQSVQDTSNSWGRALGAAKVVAGA